MQREVWRGVGQIEKERFFLLLGLLQKLDRIVIEGIGRLKIIGIELQFRLLA